MSAAAQLVQVPPRLRYVVPVAAVIVCTLIRLALDPWLGEHAPFTVFVFGIVFSAFVGGLGPGLCATALGLLACHYFFTSPRYTLLTLELPHGPLSFLLYALVGVVVSILCHILRAREESFRSLAEGMPHMVWQTDTHGMNRYQNQVWYDYVGDGPGSSYGRDWLNYYHPDDRQHLIDEWDAALQSDGAHTYDVEARIRRHDGVYRWFRIKGAPIRNRAGTIVKWVGTCTDIHELRQVEQDLRRSRQMLRNILDTVPVRVFWKDLNSVFLGCNQPFADDAGCHSPDEIIGKTDHDMGWRAEADLYRADDRLVIESGQPKLGYEEPQTTPDGRQIWLRTSKTPLRDLDGRIIGVLGTYEDITRSKTAEAALAAKQAAEEASRAKDQFLAVLSHELRTPLTPVLACVGMLQADERFDGDTRDLLTMMRRNVELEVQLIDDLLDATRIARGKIELKPERIELGDVINRAVSICRPDVEARGLALGVDLGPEGSYLLEADEMRLQQVFWNLIRNAIKFTPRGGCIGIHCRLDGPDQVVVEVRDSGMGIDAESLGRIFNAFEQGERSVTRQFGGLGLGLAICKSLVEMHGGMVSAHSEGKGKGATFTIRLPILAAGQGRTGVWHGRDDSWAAPAPSPAAPAACRILLVEDHDDTARLMKRLLEGKGYTVRTASDMATALDLVGSEPFDLLISDLGLPDGSGTDLMRALRSRGSSMPGIALSGFGHEEDIHRSHEAGFAAHLVKPATLAHLTQAITSALHPRA